MSQTHTKNQISGLVVHEVDQDVCKNNVQGSWQARMIDASVQERVEPEGTNTRKQSGCPSTDYYGLQDGSRSSTPTVIPANLPVLPFHLP